jgi:hypothetical protein
MTQHYSIDNPKFSVITELSDKVKQGLQTLANRPGLKEIQSSVDVDYTSPDAVVSLMQVTQDSFCSLVTESRYESDMPNFSEKTMRAIYAGRPFILLAPSGTLQLIKDLGFKTFDEFWDEDYDSIVDPTLRFNRVMSIVENILSNKRPDLTPFKSILEHNQKQIQCLPERMYNLLQFV